MSTTSGPGAGGAPREEMTDHELCDLLRGGEAWPMDQLWRRHSSAARAWAMKKDPAAAEDVVAESFALMFQALLAGGGPTDSFRGYLYKTMDSVFLRHWATRKRTAPIDDEDALVAEDPGTSAVALGEAEEAQAAAVALTELPERWRQVITAVDIEGRPVQEVADELRLSPNSTSALLKRARDGLRKAWLERLHRPSAGLSAACSHAVKHFGVLRWGKKGTQRRTETERHLEECDGCRSRYAQFLERASTIGLSLAALITVSRDWREKLIPTVATSAAVAASFSVTATLIPALPEPPAPHPVGVTDEGTAPQTSGAEQTGESGRRSTGLGADAAPEPTDGASRGTGSPSNAEPGPEPEESAPALLYFGDWSGWDEDQESFSREP